MAYLYWKIIKNFCISQDTTKNINFECKVVDAFLFCIANEEKYRRYKELLQICR